MMKRILVIEDNQDIRENLSEILELANYKVDQAENGKQGVEIAFQQRPDLVLCDIMMPVLDGYGVLLMLQKNQATANIPFIFLTAKSERIEVRKGMEMGADDYIIKPFDATDVINAIDGRLRKAASLREEIATGINGMDRLITLNGGKDHLDLLKENRSQNQYKKKQVIYTEGNLPSKLFYLTKGKVKTYKRNQDGKELIMGLYNQGDFFGYLPLLEGRNYRESAEALEDTELAVIPRAEFEQLMGSNPQVMKKFISVLARNLIEREEHLLATAYNSLRKKVADTLVTLYEKYNPQQQQTYEIDLTRENLAAIAGVAKESMIRMLSEFKDERLISITDSVIHIEQIDKLRHMHN
jgi:CRP-like cAMP-binding protein